MCHMVIECNKMIDLHQHLIVEALVYIHVPMSLYLKRKG
jgi:hypothetical protein